MTTDERNALQQARMMRKMMTPEKAASLAGSRQKLSRILGGVSSVYSWKDFIPEGRLWQLRCLRPEWF